MAQVFTPNFVQKLQSNLSIKIGQEPREIDVNRYGDYYFQLLIFENEDTPKLVYGTKDALQTKYSLGRRSFPSPGCHVKEDFYSPSPSKEVEQKDQHENPLAQAQLSTVRFLLQTRKLSQMIAYTWLKPKNIPDNMKTEVKLVRKILRFPSSKLHTYWLYDPSKEPKLIKEIDLLRNLLGDGENLGDGKEVPLYKFSWLIKPGHISYDFIALALLLCGQAFYQKDIGGPYTRIWEPIGSINELIFGYGVDVSWELFHGVITEIVHTGQYFPANKITIPYPPRPSKFDVSQSEIENWAKANDDDGPHPFYPPEGSDDWNNGKLKCVYPPSPYIPLSSL